MWTMLLMLTPSHPISLKQAVALQPKFLIVIVGPTAVGKTALSIQLAKTFQTEIISADARQFYRDMPIGTAQPSLRERQHIPHHFLSFLPIQATYTAGKFEKEALQTLYKLFAHQNVVVSVGGSGLYIKALCTGLAEVPTIAPSLRAKLNTTLIEKGLPYLIQLLAQKDPHYYNIVDLKNPKRVIRALEICLSTGTPYSTIRNKQPKESRKFNIIMIGLTEEKKLLHQHIDLRIDAMMEQGLLQEVEKLYPYKQTNALQTIGYKELFHYIDGVYNLKEAITHIKTNTKQYAKKQITWFKKDPNITWFTPDDIAKIPDHIDGIMHKSTSPI